MTENEPLTAVLWSAVFIAGLWILGFFVRPALDWWYQDVDTFAKLLPTVEELQKLRMDQLRLRHYMPDDPHAEAEMSKEAAAVAATIRDRLTELRTRLATLRILAFPQRWLTEVGDESESPVDHTLATLRGQMQDRSLKDARAFWARTMDLEE